MNIKAILYHADHLEYGLVTISFPIPPDQYASTVEMLQGLDIGGLLARDCMVKEVQGSAPVLKCLEGAAVNIDELDYLAKRLDSFDDKELAQFQGMAYQMGTSDMTDLINLTFCCQQATVITDFTDLETIGQDHYLNRHGGCASMEELERLDARKMALDLILNDISGGITPYGVVYDNGMRLEQLYDGRHFPAYQYSDSLMDVKLVSLHDDRQTLWLSLPMSELQLERMLCRAGWEREEAAKREISVNNLPAAIQTACVLERENIFELNAMCAAVARADLAKLEAAMAFAKPESAAEVRRLAEHLDLFDFVPNVHTPEEYGAYMIRDSGHFDYDGNLEEFYDYGKYGHRHIEQEQGVFTEQGYISYQGTMPLKDLILEDPAEHCQKEQEEGMGMGGLS